MAASSLLQIRAAGFGVQVQVSAEHLCYFCLIAYSRGSTRRQLLAGHGNAKGRQEGLGGLVTSGELVVQRQACQGSSGLGEGSVPAQCTPASCLSPCRCRSSGGLTAESMALQDKAGKSDAKESSVHCPIRSVSLSQAQVEMTGQTGAQIVLKLCRALACGICDSPKVILDMPLLKPGMMCCTLRSARH